MQQVFLVDTNLIEEFYKWRSNNKKILQFHPLFKEELVNVFGDDGLVIIPIALV